MTVLPLMTVLITMAVRTTGIDTPLPTVTTAPALAGHLLCSGNWRAVADGWRPTMAAYRGDI